MSLSDNTNLRPSPFSRKKTYPVPWPAYSVVKMADVDRLSHDYVPCFTRCLQEIIYFI